MKKILCALMLMCMIVSCAWGEVRINATNFPDGAFRVYISKNFDKDSDGLLSDAEIAGATEISINNLDAISSLQGVKYFTALTDLHCYATELTELDVSGCTALEYLVCSNNELTSLDASGCTSLKELGCGNNPLTTLDISGCTALEALGCGWTKLTELDVSHC